MGKTISITIPEKLEKLLKEESVELGVPRSRYICNILLKWKEERENNRGKGDNSEPSNSI